MKKNNTERYDLTEDMFYEEELRKVQNACHRYNYNAFLRFGEIHISTKFESWYFVPQKCGIIKLMHGNKPSRDCLNFHKQFTRKMNYNNLIQYIHEHELGKYSEKTVHFTFTKRGAYKKAKIYA